MEGNRQRARMAGKFFKTKICPWYNQGRCRLGTDCNWAHATQEVRDAVDLSKTKLCHAMADKGQCKDPHCRYAHHREELRATTDVYKTSLCVFWMRGGCFIGNKCRYAHGFNELRSQKPIPKCPAVLIPHAHKQGNRSALSNVNEVYKIAKMGWNDLNEAAIAHALSKPRSIPTFFCRPQRTQTSESSIQTFEEPLLGLSQSLQVTNAVSRDDLGKALLNPKMTEVFASNESKETLQLMNDTLTGMRPQPDLSDSTSPQHVLHQAPTISTVSSAAHSDCTHSNNISLRQVLNMHFESCDLDFVREFALREEQVHDSLNLLEELRTIVTALMAGEDISAQGTHHPLQDLGAD